MQFQTSYSDGFKAAFASQSFSVAYLHRIRLPLNIDLLGCYKLFFFLTGKKKFHIDHFVYDVEPGDLFLVNQRELHYLSQLDEEDDHERVVIFIHPDYLKSLSTEQTDLCSCFTRKDEQWGHRLKLSPKERERLMHFVHKLSGYSGFGEDIVTQSVFSELMVYINRTHRNHCLQNQTDRDITALGVDLNQSRLISPILSYIDSQITEDLSLEHLSGQFFLTSSYLCRIFKNGTGTTIHKYITAKRITLAKDLLTRGYSVTDACSLSGFKDYNGFLRSFVNAVGMPPKKYAQFGE